MDSWSYVSHEKGFSFEESISTPDLLAGSRNVLMGWEPKYHNFYNSNIQFSTPHGNEELGSIGDVLKHSVFSAKEDSSSKISGSIMESNGQGSLLIDLKLGRFIDHGDSVHKSFEGNNLSSSQSYMPSKRTRAAGLNAFCQVHGCNKDLTGSKDYHKRHKVCEAHSKTAKVIVNGIEQRFCQQCSRFHLLGEFDDGKRSCRKRLAGHNERRRKPQLGIRSGRSGRLLHSYNDLLSGTLFHPEQYRADDWCKRIKIEDSINCNPPSNGLHFYSKPVSPPYPRFHESGPSYGSRSLLHENSLVTEDLSSVFDTLSSTRRALSLLSSQSHNSSDYSSVIPMTQHAQYNGVSGKFHSSGMNNAEGNNHLNPILVLDNCGPGNFESVKDRVPCEDGTTINLLQLSSQLQRVEHQRQSSIQEKPENDGFCCLRIT